MIVAKKKNAEVEAAKTKYVKAASEKKPSEPKDSEKVQKLEAKPKAKASVASKEMEMKKFEPAAWAS